jgi:hypothetical protein
MNWIKSLLGYQSLVSISEFTERNKVYEIAKSCAADLDKPLVVVGGNTVQLWGITISIEIHGSGDACFDLNPDACTANYINADVRDIPLADKYAGAVFCSHLLEHMPTVYDAQLAMQELNRIADAVFICYPSKLNIMAWIHPDHHLWVSIKDGQIQFEQR